MYVYTLRCWYSFRVFVIDLKQYEASSNQLGNTISISIRVAI